MLWKKHTFTAWEIPLRSTILMATSTFIACSPDRQFKVTADEVEAEVNKARVSGRKVRALLLHNPTNPAGTVYSAEEMSRIVCMSQRLQPAGTGSG